MIKRIKISIANYNHTILSESMALIEIPLKYFLY